MLSHALDKWHIDKFCEVCSKLAKTFANYAAIRCLMLCRKIKESH